MDTIYKAEKLLKPKQDKKEEESHQQYSGGHFQLLELN